MTFETFQESQETDEEMRERGRRLNQATPRWIRILIQPLVVLALMAFYSFGLIGMSVFFTLALRVMKRRARRSP